MPSVTGHKALPGRLAQGSGDGLAPAGSGWPGRGGGAGDGESITARRGELGPWLLI